MKRINQITITLILSFVTLNSFSQEINCTLKGTITDRDSKELILVKAIDDPRTSGISIPVINNQFELTVKSTFTEEYYLVFKEELQKGAFRPISFFNDTSIIEFRLFPRQDFKKNTVVGGKLNTKKQAYENEQRAIMMDWYAPIRVKQDSLRKIGKYESAEMKELMAQIRRTNTQEEKVGLYDKMNDLRNNDKGFTAEANIIRSQSYFVNRKMTLRQIDYVRNNQDIYSYSLLVKILDDYKKYMQESDDVVIQSIYSSYSNQFPSHPYTKKIEDILNAKKTLKVGGKYIDFTASTIEGQIKSLSDEIGGKYALINLWSTWCGSCRATGKSIIPIYEKYKDKGFTVIGVAGINKDTKQYEIALEKDKYPWLNLIELDNKNGIWSKYNIANSGGSTWLVDSEGKILAIHPSAEEVDNILSELLK